MVSEHQVDRSAFTLTEMLVALAVGMFILNIAFASFFFTQKFVRKIESLSVVNDAVKNSVIWTMSRRNPVDNVPSQPYVRQVKWAVTGTREFSQAISVYIPDTTKNPIVYRMLTIHVPIEQN